MPPAGLAQPARPPGSPGPRARLEATAGAHSSSFPSRAEERTLDEGISKGSAGSFPGPGKGVSFR